MFTKNCGLNLKILMAFLAIGIIPFLAAGFVSVKQSKKSLSRQSFSQLESIREIKKKQVERYLDTLKNQIISFSEDKMIINAMEGFEREFENFIPENGISEDDLEFMRKELSSYYNNDFAGEYKNLNNVPAPDMKSVLKKLNDTSVAAQYRYIAENPFPLGSKDKLEGARDNSAYTALHREIHPVISSYREKFGYYDIFLIDAETGNIVYSVFKELDYSTSLISGPYAETNFAYAFKEASKAADKDFYIITDFANYLPSYNAPAGFIASPVKNGNKLVGVAVFQFPIDRLNIIMGERAGMGESGETYLLGPDKLMRSDSFLDPENRSVDASFRNPETGMVDTFAADEALSGRTGKKIITDYNGNSVLSAYTPLRSGGLTWALIAEIDEKEAFAPVSSIIHHMLLIGITGTCVIILVSFFISCSISRPIKKGVEFAETVAGGNLTGRLETDRKDEIGKLADSLNRMVINIGDMINAIKSNSQVLSNASNEMAAASGRMNEKSVETKEKAYSVASASEEMSVNMNMAVTASTQASANFQIIAAAAEQMNATIREIAGNTDKARNISNEAVAATHRTSERINKLGESAKKVDRVTDTITEIMEQTNLLALNATIEAARAGEAGKGFAVVANEIKELAGQTRDSTDEINELILGIQDSTDAAIEDIVTIIDVIKDVNDIVSAIAGSMEGQLKANDEIVENLNQAAKGIQDVTDGMAVNSDVAGEISKDISGVNIASQEILDNSERINEKSLELARIANDLDEVVNRFEVNDANIG